MCVSKTVVLSLILLVCFINLSSAQQIEEAGDVPQTEVRQILQELQSRFQDRPPYQLSFLTEFELLGGTKAGIAVNQGEMPVTYYTAEGLVRLSGEKIESFYTNAHLNNDWQKGTEYHSVWQDGRALEFRKHLESGREVAATTRVKLHDTIRPDSRGWFADGVFIDSNHYCEDLLGVPELNIARETAIAGDELLRIESDIPSGTLIVWLNTEKPVTLKRASFKASSNFVSQLDGINAFNLEVEVLEYTKIDEAPFPTKAVATYTYEIPDEPENLVNRLTTTRREIQVNPDFDSMNAFQIDFPEGTIVEDYEANVKYKWIRGKLWPTEYVSLTGKLLPELDGIKSDLLDKPPKDKMILACFFDMDQRPSRNCITQLSKNAMELEQKGVVVAGIQASGIDSDMLDEWIKKNNIPFSVGMITDDAEQIHFSWGVRALPWLILTNKEHIVITEGFSITELDEKIDEAINDK